MNWTGNYKLLLNCVGLNWSLANFSKSKTKPAFFRNEKLRTCYLYQVFRQREQSSHSREKSRAKGSN